MISDNIKKYRKDNNLSQDELAEKLGVSRQSISLWETGQTQPTIENIIALARIFNVSTDAILDNVGGANVPEEEVPAKKKKKKWLILGIIAAAVLVIGIVVAVVLLSGRHKAALKVGTESESSSQSESESESITESSTLFDTGESEKETETIAPAEPEPDDTPVYVAPVENTDDTPAYVPPVVTPEPVTTPVYVPPETTKAPEPEPFDLFSYCKDFAISKGQLNGDYCMYQQPATLYGGYENEYFSISYWGDSNMVEFCLHCPLDDTYSINFYLRMRGGYNHKYEYLSSRYFRSNGASLRSASGYIDPYVFSDSYPLSCDEYVGSFDGQTAFMEESRIGMCDLIHCLKQFVAVENMSCGFSAFEFVNY